MNGYCSLVHNRWDTRVVQYVHEHQVSTPLINTISTAACSGVHLSKPFVSLKNWLSSAVTWCSGIPVTRPPLLCTPLSELCPSTPIFIGEMECDRLVGSHQSTCQRVLLHLPLPLWLTPSIDLRRNPNKTQKATKQTCKLHSRTRAPLQLYVMCWSLEKENRGAGRQGAFSNNILSWMSIHFKGRNKKTLGCVSRCLCTKALAPLSTYFQRAGDTLAVISGRQRPLSWQFFFQERFNLHLWEHLSWQAC